jgi:hypothetical protein
MQEAGFKRKASKSRPGNRWTVAEIGQYTIHGFNDDVRMHE